jgi:signal transduction histidine kinase
LFSNLIENALKYSEADVQVKLFTRGNFPVVEVSDFGKGIPQNEKENIFTKFYRIGNENTRRTQGTGLGLFIVKYIAEKNNITITVSDNIPNGSIFTLTFTDGISA